MKFLLLDCHNLAHRAYHATGKRLDQGTTFGFLRELHTLQRTFPDYRLVFFWDHGTPKRQEILPSYKTSRRAKLAKLPDDERESYESFRREVGRIKHELLWDLGYQNVRWQSGYEADDLIAEFVQRMADTDKSIVVSSDQDLYQLLDGKRVVQLKSPSAGDVYTERRLLKDYGLAPSQWHLMKALAGCPGDDVPGVHGVGGVTAIKFLLGTLKKDGGMYRRIIGGEEAWLLCQRLVKLPYPGVKPWELREDQATKEKWRRVVKELRMLSLLEMF